MKNKRIILILFIAILCACEQHDAPKSTGDIAAQTEEIANNEIENQAEAENKTELDYELDALRLMPFLAVHDDAIAAAWLSLQDVNNQADYRPTPSNIMQYEMRIQLLAKQLKEDRRIIANRTVQTRDLLAKNQMQESLIHLLDGMIDVSRAGVEGDYGSYCQWYVNLRQSNFSHQDTIDKMKELK